MDIAQLGVRINADGVAEATRSLASLSVAGEKAAASVQDFARAGASAAQVAQLTGVSTATARDAVQRYGGQAAVAAAEVKGLALAQQEMAAAGIEANAAFNLAGAGLGRVRQGLISVLAQSTGTIPVLDRLGASVLSGFGLGLPSMVAILGGIAAVSYAWKALESDADKLASKVSDAMKKVKEETLNSQLAMGDLQVAAAQQSVASAQRAYDLARAGTYGGAGAKTGIASINANDVATTKRALDQALADLSLFQSRKSQIEYATSMESQKAVVDQLATLIKANAATKAEREQALTLEKQYTAEAAQLAKTQTDNVRRVADLQSAATLHDALNPKADADAAKKRAAEAAKALADEIDRLAKSVKGLGVEYEAFDDANDKFSAAILKQLNIAKATEIKPAKLPPDPGIAKMLADAKAAQQTIDTMLKDMQRSVSGFFDDVFTKGISSFTSLFTDIKNLFLKMIAEMMAADIMKKLAGPIAGVMAGIMGTATTAGAQTSGGSAIPDAALGMGSSAFKTAGAGLGIAGAGFGLGSILGSVAQSSGLGAAGGVLGGAAGGAATGAGIGMLGGPIGVAAGAFIGGVAGAVGGLLGFTHSASEAAKALAAQKIATDSVAVTLAQWRYQITGSAKDQKAAAELQLRLTYEQEVAQINSMEAGKKNQAQRNKDLAEAANDYNSLKTSMDNNSASMLQNTDMLNLVSGYKLAEQNFNYASPTTPVTPPPPRGGSGSTPGGLGSPSGPDGTDSGSSFNITVNTTLDGKIIATSVVKNLRKVSQAHFGNTDQVADAMAFL